MIIETKEEFLEFLKLYETNDVIIVPVMSDNKKHALNNELCVLFMKFLNSDELYIISFRNVDCINFNINILNYLKDTNNIKYIINKKKYLNILNFKNLIDLNIIYYINHNNYIELEQNYTNAEVFLLKENYELDNIYSSIPILKISQRIYDYINQLQKIILNNKVEIDNSVSFLNDTTVNNLHLIEKNGIYVNKEKLLEFFPNYNSHITSDNMIYSEYNILTTTGRPSNRFANLNFSGLNKNNGERDFIISRYLNDGFLIYFDYEAYHLNLCSDIVGYTFPSDISIHEYLGRQYFNKDILTSDEYEQSKAVSFEILYGGIDDSISKEIPFFGQVKIYIDNLWKEFKTNGYISTIISKRKIYDENLELMNPNKLFNYVIQAHETELNMLTTSKIHTLLKNYNSKLIMYLYDAFLFDIDKHDGTELIVELNNIMRNDNKFRVSTYIGYNFGNMKKIKI